MNGPRQILVLTAALLAALMLASALALPAFGAQNRQKPTTAAAQTAVQKTAEDPKGKPAKASSTKSPSLDKALAKFAAMRGKRVPREEWSQLAATFAAIAEKAPEDQAARALFAQAQVNEESGKRFSVARDFQNAAAIYLNVAERYPNHPLADDALYNRAILALDRLGDDATAQASLQRLVQSYPKADMRPRALEMLKTLEASKPKAMKAESKAEPKQDPKAAAEPAELPALKTSPGAKGKAAANLSAVDKALSDIANAPPHKDRGKPMRMGENAGTLVAQLGLTVQTIMLDAGHGGHDPGATAFGLREKNIALAIAKKVGRRLEGQGFRVIYTRTGDTFIPLERRTAMANQQKADMFVSVHLNANTKSSASGLETYSLNLAKTHEASRVAARENAIAPRRISDLQFILTDLMLSSKVRESCDLANCVQTAVLSNARSVHDVLDNGTREAPFYVLMGAKMPAVLVEVGYITNRTEAALLNSESYQELLASGIVNGILAYKHKIERYASR